MVLVLHWSPRSPYVRKVMVALHECGLAHAVQLVRTHADPMIPHKGLMQVNPLSKIPTLELEDGRVLFDSHVICRWIDGQGTAGPRLFPAGASALDAERDEALGGGLLDVALSWLVEARLRPLEQRSAALIETYRTKLHSVADWLERHVPVLHGRPFDIGHLTIGVALCYLDFRFEAEDWRKNRPRLAGWHRDFCMRPSVRATAFHDDARPSA